MPGGPTSAGTSTRPSGPRCRRSRARSRPAIACTTPASTWSASRRSRPSSKSARLRNLRDLGFPIERVIATGNAAGERSPKADAITELNPEAFVDDYLPYMRGVPAHVHTALVLRAPNGSPNVGEEMKRLARSIHPDLADFASHWLAR